MYRKGVAAIVLDQTDRILLVNLQSFKPQYYALPGGGIEAGESAIEAIYREIAEELGIRKHHLSILKAAEKPIFFDFKHGPLLRDGVEYTGQERIYFSLRFIGQDRDIHPNIYEVRTFCWVDLKHLDKYLLFEGQLEQTLYMLKNVYPF